MGDRRFECKRIAVLALLIFVSCAGLAGDNALPYHVFVSNEFSGDLSVIDPASRTEIRRIALGKRPRGLVASPDRRNLYIALSGSPIGGPNVDESKLPPPDKTADGIAVFDIASMTVLRIHRGVSDPEQVAVSADGKRLYIASEDTGQLVVISATDGKLIAKLAVGGEPEGVAVSPDGATVLVTSEADNAVTIVDAVKLSVIASVKAGSRPRNAAFVAAGKQAFVTGENDASVNLVDLPSHKVLKTVLLGGTTIRPMGVKIAPSGDRVFVTTGRGGTLAVLDAATLTQTHSLTVGPRPWGLALSPDGHTIYTANGPSNDVTVVDTVTMEIVTRIKVGDKPWGALAVGLGR